MLVAVLISVMIAVVVGISLLGSFIDTTESVLTAITTTTLEDSSITEIPVVTGPTLLDTVPIVFVVVIILAAVAWLGSLSTEGGGRSTTTVTIKTNSKRYILEVKKASDKLEDYRNNLDKLLGIQTITDPGLSNFGSGLYLWDGKLSIEDKNWDWYLVDKHPNKTIFGIIGLHKQDRSFNRYYLLGKTGPETFLEECSSTFFDNTEVRWDKLIGIELPAATQVSSN